MHEEKKFTLTEYQDRSTWDLNESWTFRLQREEREKERGGEGRGGEGRERERGRERRREGEREGERGGEEDTLTTEILCLNQFLPGLLLDFGRNRFINVHTVQ